MQALGGFCLIHDRFDFIDKPNCGRQELPLAYPRLLSEFRPMGTAQDDIRMHLKDRGLLREQCWIAGQWVDADSGKRPPVVDPATGPAIGTVPSLGVDETRRAIAAVAPAVPE